MSKQHIVKQGECFTIIARNYGFVNYRTIYDHPRNADLKRRRPNPNVLYPGDQIFIPDITERTENSPTTRVHRFVVSTSKRILRIQVEDPCWHRVANAPYQLLVGGTTFAGTTGGSGEIEHQIPNDAVRAQLKIKEHTFDLDIAHLNPVRADAADGGVSGAQGRLLNMGYDPGPIDGDAGPRTQAAVRQFQADYGLPSTGDLDDATRLKLVEIHGC